MRRLLARMERLDRAKPLRGGQTGSGSALRRVWTWRRRTGHRRTTVVAAVLCLAVTVGGTGWVFNGLQRLGVPVDRSPVGQVYSAIAPPPSKEEAKRPLGTPPKRTGSGGFTLIAGDVRHPVAFDPCRPIHFVVRSGDRPELAAGLEQAVAAVSAATGLKFVADGNTLEPLAKDRDAYQPKRYGKRWAPVLIAFTDPENEPELEDEVIGATRSVTVEAGPSGRRLSTALYVTGEIRLDLPQLLDDAERDRRGRDLKSLTRLVAEHELAHLVGLDHVKDKRQLMSPELRDQKGFGAGDLRGLAVLGRGACVPSV
jgi:hypothetical protein